MPIGSRYGRWVTTSVPYLDSGVTYVDVKCDCGNTAARRGHNLRSGKTKSCGCLAIEISVGRHGPDHQAWKGENGRVAQKLEWLYQEKAHPCTDCGQRFPAKMMQFDHVPGRGVKAFGLTTGNIQSKRTLVEIKAEREKCDLVCPNCHWLRTLGRVTDDLEGINVVSDMRERSGRRKARLRQQRRSLKDTSVIHPEPPEEQDAAR
jgi:hypothetical protein